MSPPEIKVTVELLEEAKRAIGSGLYWMDQVSRAKLSSATRGLLNCDMGMCQMAAYKLSNEIERLRATKNETTH